jgi:hypothetical protein
LDEARKEYRKEKYAEIANKLAQTAQSEDSKKSTPEKSSSTEPDSVVKDIN